MNMLSAFICMYEYRPYYMNTDAMSSFHFILLITYQSKREKKTQITFPKRLGNKIWKTLKILNEDKLDNKRIFKNKELNPNTLIRYLLLWF